ncbi:MAG: translation initiation factor IF-2 [Flavobacteriales bacterium]
MSEIKGSRLGKAATELGVSKNTIIDFLKGKKVAIDDNPMAKIDADAYVMLLTEFASDKAAAEKSHAGIAKAKQERATITLEEAKNRKTTEKVEVEKEIDYTKFKRKVEVKDVPAPAPAEPTAKPAAKKSAAKKTIEPVAEVEEAAPKKTTRKKKDEITAAQSAEDATSGEVKVVGKIDLDAVEKPKIKGRKKKDDAIAEAATGAEERKKTTRGKKKTENEETVLAAPEPAAVAKPEPEPEKELIRVNVQKLTGPKLMGHIVLPVEPEKKKPDNTKPGESGEKRKRKRVSKVDVQRQQEIDRRQQRNKPADAPKVGMSEADIQKKVSETLARLGGQGKSKSSKFRRDKRDFVAKRNEEEMIRQQAESTVLKLTEFVTVSELASMMNRQPTEIIKACMQLGIFASLNQRIDAETIHIIAEEFGYQIQFVSSEVSEAIEDETDNPEDMVSRPPVVTVMGHVDHGKTSLLDFVRKANVIGGEAGGITQHIGAYSVQLADSRKITFLDTPGHEAFTAMRARGAQVTDLAIIVVAADDSVMPQTKEAISHAQAAGVPMIFAINKIDKPDAQPDRIREQLSAMNILVEEWGGKFQSQEISAKKGLNVDALLDKVLLESELLELKANPTKRAVGTVIESSLDKGRGYVTTLLVEGGTLRVGDPIIAGQWSGRVKAMFNERGQKVVEAGPATPVELLGFEGAPNAGDKFHVMEDEREARNIALKRQQLQREQSLRTKKHLTIEEIGRRIALGDFKELSLIVKGDVDGSVEALTDSLQKLSTEKIQVRIIHKGVGQISESDVLLASASDAIVIGFQVRPSASARKLAEHEEIQIKLYSVIYKAIEEVKEAMEGLLSMKIEERVVGTAEVREVFKITKVGSVAGCYVQDGKLVRANKMRLIRDGIVIYTGELGSLKRFKDDVKDVAKGYECGLNIDKYNNIEVGDIIESFEEVEVKQTL